MNPKDFLYELYSGNEENDFFYVWNKKNKKTFWTYDIDAAAEFIDKIKNIPGNDLYISVGIGEDPEKNKRILQNSKEKCRFQENEITKLTGFYLDIDIFDKDAHKSDNYPKNIDEACAIYKNTPFEPTFVIFSGNGLHCWWLFKEPWDFENSEERNKAKIMLKKFNKYFLDKAKEELGCKIDCLCDLNRLLRVPGTKNWKDVNNPKIVKIFQKSEQRYNPEDFDELLEFVDLSSVDVLTGNNCLQTSIVNKEIKELILKLDFRNHNLSPLKFQKLKNKFGEKILKVWNKEVDKKLSSPSHYDMSLCNYGIRAGFSEQDLLSLMIKFRKMHGLDLKENNMQYYARTILNAKDFCYKNFNQAA